MVSRNLCEEDLNVVTLNKPLILQIERLNTFIYKKSFCIITYRMLNDPDWNWETIFYGHHRSISNHCDIIGQQSNQIR